MDIKELNGILDEAVKGLKQEIKDAKGEAAEAKQKAVDAMNKYEEAKAELEKSVSKDVFEAMEQRVKNLQEMADILAMKQGAPGGLQKKKNIWENLEEQFNAKKAELEKHIQAKSGHISLSLKDGIIAANAFGDRVIFGLREPGVDKEQFRERFVFDLISIVNGGPGSNPLSWVELQEVTGAGISGNPAFTAESATKPNMKWQWVENKATAETLAAVAYVTRQATLNWPLLQSEIQTELTRNIYDVLDDAVVNADGTSNTIKGIKFYAKTFNVGSISAIASDKVNDFDVVRAAISQVRRGGAPTDRKRGGFRPTVVLVSVDKAADMDLTRATDGHYIMPPFTSQDGTVIKGVRVIETNFVEDDEFIVGDFSRYLFNFVEGLRIDIGYINDQFVKNQFTIRAELMGMGRVKANEAYAFVKGTFAAAKAALVAGPAT